MIVRELIATLNKVNPDALVEIETTGYGEAEFAVELDVRATGAFAVLMGETPSQQKGTNETTDEMNGQPKYGDPDYSVDVSDIARAVGIKYGVVLPA